MLPITPKLGSVWLTVTGVVAVAEAITCCCRLSVVSVTADSEDSDRPESVTIAAIMICVSRSTTKINAEC